MAATSAVGVGTKVEAMSKIAAMMTTKRTLDNEDDVSTSKTARQDLDFGNAVDTKNDREVVLKNLYPVLARMLTKPQPNVERREDGIKLVASTRDHDGNISQKSYPVLVSMLRSIPTTPQPNLVKLFAPIVSLPTPDSSPTTAPVCADDELPANGESLVELAARRISVPDCMLTPANSPSNVCYSPPCSLDQVDVAVKTSSDTSSTRPCSIRATPRSMQKSSPTESFAAEVQVSQEMEISTDVWQSLYSLVGDSESEKSYLEQLGCDPIYLLQQPMSDPMWQQQQQLVSDALYLQQPQPGQDDVQKSSELMYLQQISSNRTQQFGSEPPHLPLIACNPSSTQQMDPHSAFVQLLRNDSIFEYDSSLDGAKFEQMLDDIDSVTSELDVASSQIFCKSEGANPAAIWSSDPQASRSISLIAEQLGRCHSICQFLAEKPSTNLHKGIEALLHLAKLTKTFANIGPSLGCRASLESTKACNPVAERRTYATLVAPWCQSVRHSETRGRSLSLLLNALVDGLQMNS